MAAARADMPLLDPTFYAAESVAGQHGSLPLPIFQPCPCQSLKLRKTAPPTRGEWAGALGKAFADLAIVLIRPNLCVGAQASASARSGKTLLVDSLMHHGFTNAVVLGDFLHRHALKEIG